MAEKDWRETMGAPFAEAEEPQYDVGAIRRATTDTPAHAEMFNGVFQQLIDNTAAVKRMAEGTQETLEREISNPNLLENWDFRNPVNRNGKEEYTEGSITIDNWRLVIRNYESSVLVNGGDVTFRITNSSSLGKPPFFGTYKTRGMGKATYTISLLVKEVNGLFSLGVQWDGAPWTTVASIEGLRIGLNTCTFSIPENNVPLLIFVMGENVGSITMEAIKLELGDHQTLARQNDLGEWEIIDPPNYDLQYALCSQYNPANGEWQGFAPGNIVTQLQAQYISIKLSDMGDDATADGTANNPFKTIGAALKKYQNPKINFWCDTTYTFSETIVIANRSTSFQNGTWHMKGLIYLYSSFLAWQNCTVNWYAGFGHIKMQGMCGFMFGDYYQVEFKALAQDGTKATGTVPVITAFNSDVNDKIKGQGSFAAATAYRFKMNAHVMLFSTAFGGLMVLWRPVETTIFEGAKLYNNSVAMDQIGTSGVYVLR